MKARKIEFKVVESKDQNMPGTFRYEDGLIMIAESTAVDGRGNSLGMSSDEILRAVEIKSEIKKAGDAVILSEDHYQWLLSKLNFQMRWRVDTEVVAQFIKDFRAAPEVEVAEAKKD